MNFKTFFFTLSFSVFFSQKTFSEAPISLDKFTQAIKEAFIQNSEIQYITKLAKKMKVRAWLFEDAASGLVYYVKKDLERKTKREDRWFEFQEERFDYDYMNIYRFDQHIVIVIDGSDKKARIMKKALSKKFPYFQQNSNESIWKVRALKNIRKKGIKQYTDSYSAIMVELTKSEEPIIRSIREWGSEDLFFLKDILKGEISYYFSKNHGESVNPEMFSVIRYLIKMFQYKLAPKKEDLEGIKEIIREFSASELKTSYEKFWWEMNVRKLFTKNIDLEKSWKILDELGLREKLISMESNKKKRGSLAWWFNKEPLKTKKIEEGASKNANELGLKIVSHSIDFTTASYGISNFTIYEMIIRSFTGRPNVFVSRNNITGDYEKGFYTLRGKEGIRGTDFTVRFHVHPEAREGIDFTLMDNNLYNSSVIFFNKAALKVIPEIFNKSFIDFFEFLIRDDKDWSWNPEKALIERLSRTINRKWLSGKVSNKDVEYVYKEIILDSIKKKSYAWETVVQEWFKLDVSLKHFEYALIHLLIRVQNGKLLQTLLEKHIINKAIIKKLNKEYPNWKKFFHNAIRRREKSKLVRDSLFESKMSKQVQNSKVLSCHLLF